MNKSLARRRRRRFSPLAIAAILAVVLGTLIFSGGSLMSLFWPLFFLAPGLAMFAAIRRFGTDLSLLALPATMATMFGGLLFLQNLTGLWSTWAYAWTLLVPTSIGLGLAFYGDLERKEKVARTGARLARGGLWMFAAGLVFFEVLLNLSGLIPAFLAPLALPLLIIGGGALYFRRRATRRSLPRRAAPGLASPLEMDDFAMPRRGVRQRR